MLKYLKNLSRSLSATYAPDPNAREFLDHTHERERDGLRVRVAVPDAAQGHRYFGVPVARHGIQPIWIEVTNNTPMHYRLQCVALDPYYFSTYEAAAICHFSGLRRLLGFGLLAWLFLPFTLLLIVKLIRIGRANRRMDVYFRDQAFRLKPVEAGATQAGFVYATRNEGTRTVLVRLLGPEGPVDFQFAVAVPGLNADYRRILTNAPVLPADCRQVNLEELRDYIIASPAATTNRHGRRCGDPVNLAIVADIGTILGAFGSRWDETEVISLASCWRTVKAFLMGTEYRYSPISGLYLYGRPQDFALQRIRASIHERMHLRLWLAPVQFKGTSVWIGQVSRDISVRFTRHTWNLMTHRIDPDVDEARDFVVEDLLHYGRVDIAAYVDGVGACDRDTPRRNLTGDPYYTDGKRAAVIISCEKTEPRFVALD